MVVALFGRSQTGKTSLGRAIARTYAVDLRSCGEIVKETATKLGLSADSLGSKAHKAVDLATQDWVLGREAAVVEGRFLDVVLAPVASQIVLVSLEASPTVRLRRLSAATGTSPSIEAIHSVDQADDKFRADLYGPVVALSAEISVDTSKKTVQECLQELLPILESIKRRG